MINNNRQEWQKTFSKFAPYIGVVLVLAIIPPFLPTYYLSMLTKIVIFAIFAISLDLVLGYTGLISLGHATFLGVSGYTIGILMIRLGIDSFWILIPLALIVSAIVAAFVGYIALRVSGVYFLLITLAFAQLFYVVAVKWRAITGGSDGLVGINYPSLGIVGFTWSNISYYYFILLAFIICFLLLSRIVNSSFGHTLVGIRENETRMRSLGYNTWLYKYIAFIIGGVFAGVAGAVFAPFYGAMVPEHFGLTTSSMVMLMVVIGSPGTLYGPVVGAIAIILIEQIASIYSPERWPLILGAVFILSVLFLRGGIGIYLAKLRKRNTC
jgi:branched-chain amino acid transport system permease protein